MAKFNLTGVQTMDAPETRPLVHLEIEHNDTVYNWSIFVPPDVSDLGAYLTSISDVITSDIDAKEAQWAALSPKTRVLEDPTGSTVTVPISKEEIVHPDTPDYYALRRNSYPSIGDQLGALWKGVNSEEFLAMQDRIQQVKNMYPKPPGL